MGLATFKYKTNKGSIFRVKFDDNTLWQTATGAEPTEALTETLTLKISRNNTEVGGTPRLAIFHRLAQQNQNAGPYNGTCISPEPEAVKYVPVLKPDHTIASGTTIVINGASWRYSGNIVEESFY
mgnify:CR=1 FL=1